MMTSSRSPTNAGLATSPSPPKAPRWPSSTPIVLMAILGTLTTLLLFTYVSAVEQRHAQEAFSDAARDRLWALRRETAYALSSVKHVGSFFDASREVTRQQFREFVGPMLTRYPGTQALLWVPRVTSAQRAEVVQQARRFVASFEVLPFQTPAATTPDLDAPATDPGVIYPILYIQPYPDNRSLLGVDLATWPEAARTLHRAVAERTLSASAPISIHAEQIDGQPRVTGIAAFIPIYGRVEPALAEPPAEGADTAAPTDPQPELRGFVGGLFRIHDLAEIALSNLRPTGIDLHLYEGQPGPTAQPFYVHESRLPKETDEDHGFLSLSFPLSFRDQIEVADQTWTLVATAVPGHFESDFSSSTLILGSGLSFTLLACVYLSSMIGKARQVRRLVAERTLELERSNAALNNEIKDRQQAEEALKQLNLTLEQRIEQRTRESERRARDLEQFAYVASHDLKAPLRGIANLATWLSQDLEDRLTPEIAEQLALMRDRVARMNALIEGLLTYSRIGRIAGAAEPIDLGRLIAETVDSLAPPPGFKVEVAADLPDLTGDSLALGMVLGNLIGNAIKHHDRAEGHIQVTVQCDRDRCEFSVADDGPGIPPEFHDNVFLMFQTMKVKDLQGDTGIGLALVKKLVEEQGGRIQLHSGPGRGCRFVFTWPRRPPRHDHS